MGCGSADAGDRAAVGQELAGVVEDDDAVAQQAPSLPGVAGDGAGRVTAGSVGGAGGWWGHMARLRHLTLRMYWGPTGPLEGRAGWSWGWPGRDGAGCCRGGRRPDVRAGSAGSGQDRP
jgi:hypothetical protein